MGRLLPGLRLVHTVERYAPEVGGAERVVQRMSEGLAQRGHQVTVVTSGPRSSGQLNGVRVERFPVRGNRATGIRGDTEAVASFIESLRPDVVFNYAAQTWHTDLFASRIARPRDYAVVLAPCGFSALHDPIYRPYFSHLKGALPYYDALVFHSTIYRDWQFTTEAGVAPQEMHVIPNAADEPAPRSRRSRPETTFVTVGSHVRSKGHGEFIRAVHRLRRDIGARGYVVAPSRRGTERLRGCQPACLVEGLRPGRLIRFIEGSRAGVVEETLAMADVLLFPSRIECAPLAILEAMAAEVPWISYDVGNVAELEGGFVVHDFDELVARARALALDTNERDRLGRAGHAAWNLYYRWPHAIDRYEELFRTLAVRMRRSPGASGRRKA